MKKVKMTMAARRLYNQRKRLMRAKEEYNVAKRCADSESGGVNLCAWSICEDLLRHRDIPDSALEAYKEFRNRADRATRRFEKAQEDLLIQSARFHELNKHASAHDVGLSFSIP